MKNRFIPVFALIICASLLITGCVFENLPFLSKNLTAAELYNRANRQLDESNSFNVRADYSVSISYMFMDVEFKISEKAKGCNNERYLQQKNLTEDTTYEMCIYDNMLYLDDGDTKEKYHSPSYFDGEPELFDYMPLLTEETLSAAEVIENEDGTKSFTVLPTPEEIEFMLDEIVHSAIASFATVKESDITFIFSFDENDDLQIIDFDMSLTLSSEDESMPGIKMNVPMKIKGSCRFINIGKIPKISAPLDKDEYEDCGNW